MRTLDAMRLREHPELASLSSLMGQLDQLPAVMASVYDEGQRDARAEQARSMARISKVLQDQIRAYVGMIDEEIGRPAERRR